METIKEIETLYKEYYYEHVEYNATALKRKELINMGYLVPEIEAYLRDGNYRYFFTAVKKKEEDQQLTEEKVYEMAKGKVGFYQEADLHPVLEVYTEKEGILEELRKEIEETNGNVFDEAEFYKGKRITFVFDYKDITETELEKVINALASKGTILP